jgi:hypothetical protein
MKVEDLLRASVAFNDPYILGMYLTAMQSAEFERNHFKVIHCDNRHPGFMKELDLLLFLLLQSNMHKAENRKERADVLAEAEARGYIEDDLRKPVFSKWETVEVDIGSDVWKVGTVKEVHMKEGGGLTHRYDVELIETREVKSNVSALRSVFREDEKVEVKRSTGEWMRGKVVQVHSRAGRTGRALGIHTGESPTYDIRIDGHHEIIEESVDKDCLRKVVELHVGSPSIMMHVEIKRKVQDVIICHHAEVQLYLAKFKDIEQVTHRTYEIVRSTDGEDLLYPIYTPKFDSMNSGD